MSHSRPIIVVSACLLGAQVRHDGGHTRAPFLTEQLARFVEFRPLCPEEGAGMGTPRETVRLVDHGDGALRMIGNKSGDDWTERMQAYSKVATANLEPDGFILKKGSPSCGLFRVRRYAPDGNRYPSDAMGLFAQHVRENFGHLPMEEEGRLMDPGLRHQFLVRTFARHRVRVMRETATRHAEVSEFHRREKLLLMAHTPAGQKELGRLIADWKGSPRDLAGAYAARFTELMASRTHRGRMVNVMQHMAGYLRGKAEPADIAELTAEIDAFQRGVHPAATVWMLLRHHIRRHDVEYLADQTVLAPYPVQLLDPTPDPHLDVA